MCASTESGLEVQGEEIAFPAQREGCQRTRMVSTLKPLQRVGVAQPHLEEKETHGGLNLSAVVQGSYEEEKGKHQLACLHGEAALEQKFTLPGRDCLVRLVPH